MAKVAANAGRKIRPAAVAGPFYPRDPSELRNLIGAFLGQTPPPRGPAPKALIAPHAGYVYSGPIAASAFAQFAPERESIKRVVILGPSHYVAFAGLATSSAEAFATPLGLVPVDVETVVRIRELPGVVVLDEAHAHEHSLEVHLPFLQYVLNDFKIMPLVVGDASAGDVSGILDALWGGPETRFVISSDLSHYHDYQSAQRLDGATARAIERLRPNDIAEGQACGRIPIHGLLCAAQRRGLRVRTIDLRNSGDTAGSRDRVVGYGAFAFDGTGG